MDSTDSYDTSTFDLNSNLINPIDSTEINSFSRALYQAEFNYLTPDEFLILDFIGANSLKDDIFANVTMSFQGIKRIIDLHQAKLSKAMNRLVSKGLLKKDAIGYALTDEGYVIFNRVSNEFRNLNRYSPKIQYSYVADGLIQGPQLLVEQFNQVLNSLTGKWFGNFRFTSVTKFDNKFEIGWVATNGVTYATFILGLENNLQIIVTGERIDTIQNELHFLINHISQVVEKEIDAPIIITAHQLYENSKKIPHLLDNAKIAYAG